jgi:predicted RNA methylase
MLDNEFYPTPSNLAKRMVSMVCGYADHGYAILEPSAGKGDLIQALRNYDTSDIDAVEIDPDLRSVLKAKNIRVVHGDFLTFNTLKRYDCILMNPPFSHGVDHLTKALTLLKPGGSCVCLLNKETVENLYSNSRKALKQQLDDWDAFIEVIPDAFKDAERRTNVDVSLIYVTKPETEADYDSILLDTLKKAEEQEYRTPEQRALIDNDPIHAAVAHFWFETKLGLKLLQEYEALKPYLKNKLSKDDESDHSSSPLIKIGVTQNDYIRATRKKILEGTFAKS